MLKEFTEIAAHELRTPIQPILGFTQHLRDKVTDKEQADYLEIIDRNTKRLKKLTEDILEISKIENNLFNLNKEQFDIKEFIRNLVNNYKKQVETKNIEFEFVDFCNNDSLFIYADKNKISQVLSNLIGNSIKFIPDEKEVGNITITIEKKAQDKGDKNGGNAANFDNQGSAIITVKDNGIGIDKDILPILFKKFSSKSFQGTGLGLYISKRIIEAHSGKIWAQNNEDGKKGATFSFSIPLKNKENSDTIWRRSIDRKEIYDKN
jgi:two-component system sensor histidine kinase VicK